MTIFATAIDRTHDLTAIDVDIRITSVSKVLVVSTGHASCRTKHHAIAITVVTDDGTMINVNHSQTVVINIRSELQETCFSICHGFVIRTIINRCVGRCAVATVTVISNNLTHGSHGTTTIHSMVHLTTVNVHLCLFIHLTGSAAEIGKRRAITVNATSATKHVASERIHFFASDSGNTVNSHRGLFCDVAILAAAIDRTHHLCRTFYGDISVVSESQTGIFHEFVITWCGWHTTT